MPSPLLRPTRQSNSVSNTLYGGINLITSLDGLHQYGAWYDLSDELHIGHIERGVQRWGVDHDEVTISGAARTALELPIDGGDDHDNVSIGIGHNLDGSPRRIYVWANMHANTLKMIRTTTTDGSIASWEADTLPTTVIVSPTMFTYPQPCQHEDGSLTIILRVGASGNGDVWWWNLPVGSDTWEDPPRRVFLGRTSLPNESAYITPPYYDVSTGRWWMAWVWREDPADAFSNFNPCCAYSDDEMQTWRTVDGTLLTLPQVYETITASSPITLTGGEAGLTNWGTITTDSSGNPHMTVSRNPFYHVWWDGASWQQQQIGTTGGTLVNGIYVLGRCDVANINGRLVFATAGKVSSTLGERALTVWGLEDSGAWFLSPQFDKAISGGWECSHDPGAMRLFGSYEVLLPFGDDPFVASFGRRSVRQN